MGCPYTSHGEPNGTQSMAIGLGEHYEIITPRLYDTAGQKTIGEAQKYTYNPTTPPTSTDTPF